MQILDPSWLEHSMEKRWLVGVSGGRDSVALLHACVQAGLKELVVVHINHGLRGEESDGDEDFVRALSEAYELEYICSRHQVDELATKQKKSLELAARETRHSVFSTELKARNYDGVLLAHHAEDQAETVLFNLFRGSAGLKGMQQIQHIESHDLTIHRPLLDTSRADINQYIQTYQLSYREDSSNAEDFATRNRLRNEAIPLLEEIMGRKITPAIVRALNTSQKAHLLLEESVHYESHLDPQGRLFLPSLEKLPTPLAEQVLHRYLKLHNVSNISQDLIDSAISLLDKEQPAKINLPQGNFLRRSQQRIFIELATA